MVELMNCRSLMVKEDDYRLYAIDGLIAIWDLISASPSQSSTSYALLSLENAPRHVLGVATHLSYGVSQGQRRKHRA
jgi:hypothetical protein